MRPESEAAAYPRCSVSQDCAAGLICVAGEGAYDKGTCQPPLEAGASCAQGKCKLGTHCQVHLQRHGPPHRMRSRARLLWLSRRHRRPTGVFIHALAQTTNAPDAVPQMSTPTPASQWARKGMKVGLGGIAIPIMAKMMWKPRDMAI